MIPSNELTYLEEGALDLSLLGGRAEIDNQKPKRAAFASETTGTGRKGRKMNRRAVGGPKQLSSSIARDLTKRSRYCFSTEKHGEIEGTTKNRRRSRRVNETSAGKRTWWLVTT